MNTSQRSSLSRETVGNGVDQDIGSHTASPGTLPSPSESLAPINSGHKDPLPVLAPPPARAMLPPAMTPTRKPVQRQKSPLSHEAFNSPANKFDTFSEIMSFENTAQSQGTPQMEPPVHSKGKKRLSSMRDFMPFKVLRRGYGNNAGNIRDQRVSDDHASDSSLNSEFTLNDQSHSQGTQQPSLRKKISRSFWSVRNTSTAGEAVRNQTPQLSTDGSSIVQYSHPSLAGPWSSDVSRPASPVYGELSDRPKRKSGSFWRRTSSLTLARTMSGEKLGWSSRSQQRPGSSLENYDADKASLRGFNGTPPDAFAVVRPPGVGPSTTVASPASPRVRSISPKADKDTISSGMLTPSLPPQLPPIDGTGDGLGLDDDYFASMALN